MKTAVSIPDPIFRQADATAKRLGLSRSELYAQALAKYLREAQGQQITDALNALYEDAGTAPDSAVLASQTRQLRIERW